MPITSSNSVYESKSAMCFRYTSNGWYSSKGTSMVHYEYFMDDVRSKQLRRRGAFGALLLINGEAKLQYRHYKFPLCPICLHKSKQLVSMRVSIFLILISVGLKKRSWKCQITVMNTHHQMMKESRVKVREFLTPSNFGSTSFRQVYIKYVIKTFQFWNSL